MLYGKRILRLDVKIQIVHSYGVEKLLRYGVTELYIPDSEVRTVFYCIC